MIAVGDPLGKRFTVSKAPEEVRVGALFEVIDRDAAVVTAQLLGITASATEHLADLRPVLGAVPSNSALLRPREITVNRASLPVAIFPVASLVPVRERLGEVVDALGKPATVAALFNWFAAIATDLDRVHGANVCHGTIKQQYFVCPGGGVVERCVLVGFGIDALARRTTADLPEATPRRDLVDLLTALHDLFVASGVNPEGGASGKWTLLRHSSQHGEHPALASGTELGKTLVELAKLCVEPTAPLPSMRPPRHPTLAPPGRASTGSGSARNPSMPPPRGNTGPREDTLAPAPRGDRSTRGPRAATQVPPPAPKPSRPWLRGLLVGVGLAVLVGGAGVAYLSTLKDAPISLGMLRPGHRRVAAAPRCEGETLDPPAGYEIEAAEFDLACAPDDRTLVAVARHGTQVLTASREARRGQAWRHLDASEAANAVELGTAVNTSGGLWISWRNGVGEPMGLAEVSRDPHAHAPVHLSGWDNVPLRGAMLLHRDANSTWLVSNVESEGGAHPVLFQVATGDARGRAPVQTWYLGAGTVESVVPGPAPALLFHQREGENGHRLSVLWPQLALLGAAHPGGDATSVRGATPPEAALRRSPSATLPGTAEQTLAATFTGAALGDEAGFVVTLGPPLPREQCAARGRCVGPGAVHLLRFSPTRPEPLDLVLSPTSIGLDLSAAAPDHWLVLHQPEGPAAHPALQLSTVAGAVPTHATLANPGANRGRLVRCGGSLWLGQQLSRPTPRIVAVPTECLTTR